VTNRGARWGGASIRGVEAGFDHADPTGGRHAFDRDAALTPIFTTLRRGGWQRPRPQPSPSSVPQPARPHDLRPVPGHRPPPPPRPLRPVRDPVAPWPPEEAPFAPYHDDAEVTRFRNDPLTAPIPVVPSLYAVDGAGARNPGPADGYPHATGSLGPAVEAPGEPTTWWRSPMAGVHGDPAPYAPGVHHAAYDEPVFDERGYDGYEESGYDQSGYDDGGYDEPTFADARYDAPAWYALPRRHPRPATPVPYDPMSYDPVTDSGRHHRRLAPAGW
jgi:hypothetical protein